MTALVWLGFAIAIEVGATLALKASDGFGNQRWAALALAGYGLAFYGLAQSLRGVPIGVAYALWGGAGTVGIVAIGWLYHHEALNTPSLFGVGLIAAGTVLLGLFTEGH